MSSMSKKSKKSKMMTEVETSPTRTLQFSTSVELYTQNVCLLVGLSASYDTSYIRILLIFGQKLDIDILI